MHKHFALATIALALASVAAAQAKDDFEYWDANSNGDLTCAEAAGRDEGLRLPAYQDNRDGTGTIYEWLERERSSDRDSDGMACDSSSNPHGYIPGGSTTITPESTSDDCDVVGTWMGLRVCEEHAQRTGYRRDDYSRAYRGLEDEIIAGLPQVDGQVYTPYTCTLYDIQADGTAATDIEHIVALAEAHDSGIGAEDRQAIASDLLNLTIAVPYVNQSEKNDRDAGDWGPSENRGWFAARVVAVKQKYGLSVDPAERDALAQMLRNDADRTVICK